MIPLLMGGYYVLLKKKRKRKKVYKQAKFLEIFNETSEKKEKVGERKVNVSGGEKYRGTAWNEGQNPSSFPLLIKIYYVIIYIIVYPDRIGTILDDIQIQSLERDFRLALRKLPPYYLVQKDRDCLY